MSFRFIDDLVRSGRVFWQLCLVTLTGRIRPVFVYLHLTNRCNLKCSYCYANVDDRFHDQDVKDISTKQWLALISDTHGMGARYFHLYGGEPLIRADIDKIVEHCLSLGALVEIMTNGHYVPRKIKLLKKAHSVCLSIDGNKTKNDKIRGEGNYAAVEEAVRICKENDIPVRLHATINAFNISDPDFLPKLARNWNTTISYSMPHIPEYITKNTVSLKDSDIIIFLKRIRQMKLKGYPIDNTFKSLDYSIGYPLPLGKVLWDIGEVKKTEKRFGKKLFQCVFAKQVIIVDSEGYVIKCINHGMRDGLKFQDHGFKKAYYNAMNSKDRPFSCSSCSYIQFVELNNSARLSLENIIKGIKYHLAPPFSLRAGSKINWHL